MAIVDGHDVVRAGVERWLAEHRPTLRVAGSFTHPAECLSWLAAGQEADVLVTEIQSDGHAPDIDALRLLCTAGPPVVVHSRLTADEVILSSIDAGAHCYVAKADGRQHLLAAIDRAGAGRPYVAPHMADALQRCKQSGRLNLSERERQVLLAWLRTESKDEVAQLLHIAPATVRTHLQRVRTKYASVGRPASTKSALMARAVADGIIGLGDLTAECQPIG
ncbi:MAG: LuxR C-terminal-related transcriptional regulator [Mycobacterium sp.]